MTGPLLSDATVDAIAELGGVDGVMFEEDVRPALAAAGLKAVAMTTSRSTSP